MLATRTLRGTTARAAAPVIILGAAIALLSACGSSASSGKTTSKHASAPPTHYAPTAKTAKVVNVPPNLPPSALSADEVQAMLNAHNTLRQKYGQPALVWDNDLAAYAQDWANQTAQLKTLQHRDPNEYGENIYYSTNASTPQAVVDSWASEVQFFDTTTNTCPDYNQCGHFTQEVWSTTTTLGCGKANGGNTDLGSDTGEYWVCNYMPAGNLTNGQDNSVKPF